MRCSIYADLWQYTTNASYTRQVVWNSPRVHGEFFQTNCYAITGDAAGNLATKLNPAEGIPLVVQKPQRLTCLVVQPPSVGVVVPDIIGGIGNQLFITSAAVDYVLRNTTRMSGEDDVAIASRHVHMDHGVTGIFSYGGDRPVMFDDVFSHLPAVHGRTDLDAFRVDEAAFNNSPGVDLKTTNVLITGGYYQDWRIAFRQRDTLRHLFRPSDELASKVSAIDIPDRSCAVHIRVSDQWSPESSHEYYTDSERVRLRETILHLQQSGYKMLYFTNGTNEQLQGVVADPTARKQEYDSTTEMYMMGRCSCIILSASTFCWWAAFLAPPHTRIMTILDRAKRPGWVTELFTQAPFKFSKL